MKEEKKTIAKPTLGSVLELEKEIVEDEPVLEARIDVPKVGYVNCPLLNVREKASKESAVVKTLTEGCRVDIIKESGEWFEIKPHGFVMSEFIKY